MPLLRKSMRSWWLGRCRVLKVLRAGTIEVPGASPGPLGRWFVRPADRFIGMLEFGPFRVAADGLYAAFRLMCEAEASPFTEEAVSRGTAQRLQDAARV